MKSQDRGAINSRLMRLVRHVVHMRALNNTYEALLWQPERKSQSAIIEGRIILK
jgi:hypothetical protein